MRRIVKRICYTYAENKLVDGKVETKVNTITVNESNEKKAYKQAANKIGNFIPLKTETVREIYEIDDETFFAHAKRVE